MRRFWFTVSIIAFLISYSLKGYSQPIPIELMMGNKYGAFNLAFNKNFSEESRFGFFHMNTIQFYYNNHDKNSFILQDLLYVETFKNLRAAGGIAYTKGGFAPTAGLQYVYAGKKLFFLCAPRINIESDPSYDIMTIIQFKPQISDRIKLYTRGQFLNVFNSGGNIRSYQWIRLGLEMKGIQFGAAVNLDEFGPSPSVEASTGLFVRIEIF